MESQFEPENEPRSPDPPPPLRGLSQYVKELSFHNFMGAAAGQVHDGQPKIEMAVEVLSRPIGEEGEAFEVDLRIDVQARRGDMKMFSVNLVYSGLFQILNSSPERTEELIWVECPRLLLPFSRQIIADVTRDGGYPPLLISPIDFAPLYQSEQRARQTRQAEQSIPLA